MTFDSVSVAQMNDAAEQGAATIPGDAASQARGNLSIHAGEAARDAAQSSTESVGERQLEPNAVQDEDGNILIHPLKEKGHSGSDAQTQDGNGPANRIDGNDAQISEGLGDGGSKIGESIIEMMKKAEPSEKEREAAKKELAEGISKLIPEEDRNTLVGMQEALIDGNLESFQKLVGSLKDNPEKLAAMIKELNNGLDRAEWGGGVNVQQDSKGNVLLYKQNGDTAIEINPQTGQTTLRPVEPRFDGTAVIQPGEVIGADAGKVMRDIGNEATESLMPQKFGDLKPLKPFQPLDPFKPFKPFKPLDPQFPFDNIRPDLLEDPGLRIRPELRFFDGNINPYYESK